MDAKVLSELVKKLEGLNWLFFAGSAVEIYTNGKRKAGDLDILLFGKKEVDIFASRLGCAAKSRRIEKGNIILEDYGFTAKFLGQEVEAIDALSGSRFSEDLVQRVFQRKLTKAWLGTNVFVIAIEELIAQKARMHRPKDIEDLKLLANQKIDMDFVRELANGWGNYSETIATLKQLNYPV